MIRLEMLFNAQAIGMAMLKIKKLFIVRVAFWCCFIFSIENLRLVISVGEKKEFLILFYINDLERSNLSIQMAVP